MKKHLLLVLILAILISSCCVFCSYASQAEALTAGIRSEENAINTHTVALDSDNINSIISGVATVFAAVGAAVIAGVFARKVAKDVTSPFHSSEGNPEKLGHYLMDAKESVYFVMISGEIMLEQYLDVMKYLLGRKIKLNFLVLDKDLWRKHEGYIDGDQRDEIYEKSRGYLKELRRVGKDLVEIKAFDQPMSASYVGIDIDAFNKTDSFVTMRVYQYNTKVKYSPIIRIKYKDNPQHFKTTASCIQKMYAAAKPIRDEDL